MNHRLKMVLFHSENGQRLGYQNCLNSNHKREIKKQNQGTVRMQQQGSNNSLHDDSNTNLKQV